ncbi:hypothetical protein Vretifemale_7762, partial [Volvox reticuliferus]
PRPPPPSPPPPCEVCISITITSFPVPDTFRFDDPTCTRMQTLMAKDINAQAAAVGARLLTPFAADLYECYPEEIRVCGVFFSDADGQKLQPWISSSVPYINWYDALFPGSCSAHPEIAGYSFKLWASNYDGGAGCLTGSFIPPSCTTLPPPPPPRARPPPRPPAVTFPQCECDKRSGSSTLTFSRVNVTDLDTGMRMYCFVVGLTSCLRSSPCCAQDLSKIEFSVLPACVGSVAYSATDGALRSAQFQLKPYPAIKINNIAKPYIDVDGTEVCLLLRPPCDTLESLCGGPNCLYALFNNRLTNQPKCCPVRNVLDPLLN